MSKHLCGCIKCVSERLDKVTVEDGLGGEASYVFSFPGPGVPGWRYNCEICGNKRCPHHTDHRLTCTGSNDPGQAGSIYA